jgi:hypothetical protein
MEPAGSIEATGRQRIIGVIHSIRLYTGLAVDDPTE